jgi:AcrR family transcriptional regulator
MPNRAPELEWDEPAATGRLNRATILAAAMRIADDDGLDAVSIRRIAAELDARPMSLYTHIASKDDLVALMFNEALADALVPEPMPTEWREALSAIGRHTHTTFLAHPWTLDALGAQRLSAPNVLRHIDQSERAVAGMGLGDEDAQQVLVMVDDYALGHTIRVLALRRLEMDSPRPMDFETGLQTLLDGIEKRYLG